MHAEKLIGGSYPVERVPGAQITRFLPPQDWAAHTENRDFTSHAERAIERIERDQRRLRAALIIVAVLGFIACGIGLACT